MPFKSKTHTLAILCNRFRGLKSHHLPSPSEYPCLNDGKHMEFNVHTTHIPPSWQYIPVDIYNHHQILQSHCPSPTHHILCDWSIHSTLSSTTVKSQSIQESSYVTSYSFFFKYSGKIRRAKKNKKQKTRP